MNWHGDKKENERTQDAQEMSQKMWFDFQLNLRARYSGGRRGGGTLAKGAAVAWGSYQVEVFLKE